MMFTTHKTRHTFYKKCAKPPRSIAWRNASHTFYKKCAEGMKYVMLFMLLLCGFNAVAWMDYDPNNPRPTDIDIMNAQQAERDARTRGDHWAMYEHQRNAIDMEWRKNRNEREDRERRAREEECMNDVNQFNQIEVRAPTEEEILADELRRQQEEAAFKKRMDGIAKKYPVKDSRRFDVWWMKVRNHVMAGSTTSQETRLKEKAKKYYYEVYARGNATKNAKQDQSPTVQRNSTTSGSGQVAAYETKEISLMPPKPSQYGSRKEFVKEYIKYAEDNYFGDFPVEERKMVEEKAKAQWNSYYKK